MPMKKGHSMEVISQNIKEMMKAGHPKAQAVAAAVAHARKFKKMAEGGMVGSDEELDDNSDPMVSMGKPGMPKSESLEEMGKVGPEDYITSLEEERILGTPKENKVENESLQDEQMMLAQALKKKRMGMMEGYAMGGLVEPMKDSMEGNKPEEDMEDSGEEPLSMLPMEPESVSYPMNKLSEEVKDALKKKKMARRFS